MSDRPAETLEVARLIEGYANGQHRDVAKYSNRELLDESGIYDLHTVAARIYELGFNAGVAVEACRNNEQRQRIRDAARDKPEGDEG